MRRILAIAISLVTAGYLVFTLNISGSLEALPFGNKILGGLLFFVIFFGISFFVIQRILGNGGGRGRLPKVNGVLFISFFGIFLLGGISGMNMVNDVSLLENRILNKFPDVNPFHETFPGRFNDFVDDRVGLRSQAANIYRKISPYLFDGLNMSRIALVGKDHWLFYNDESDTVQNYQRVVKYTQTQYEEIKKHLDNVKTFCNANDIKFYFMVPPNKSTIYPEFYPDFIKHLNQPTSYEVLADYISSHVDITFVNIYDNMIKEKDNFNLYYKEDSHWNSTGAYFAYQKLAEAIAKDFPGFSIVKQEDLSRCDVKKQIGDITSMLGGYEYNYAPTNEFCITEPIAIEYKQKNESAKSPMGYLKTARGNGLKIMIFHDSFMTGIRPFIHNGVSESKDVWFYETSPLAYEKEILEYQPDIIIWEMLERGIPTIMSGKISYEKR